MLNNAAYYTEPSGEIRLMVRREGHEAVIRVRDSGIGIDPEELPRLFTTFTRLDVAHQHHAKGLGLGLALVQKLVQLHGGHLTATSAGKGQGSEFTVRLPALPPAWRPEEAPRPLADEDELPGRRLLLVEDDQDAARSLAMLLRTLGQEVQILHQGEGAVDRAREWKPDLIIIDIGLPGISGYEVARQVRRTLGDHTPCLVALTGYGLDEDRRRASEAGFDYHLTKPADLEALQRILRGPD